MTASYRGFQHRHRQHHVDCCLRTAYSKMACIPAGCVDQASYICAALNRRAPAGFSCQRYKCAALHDPDTGSAGTCWFLIQTLVWAWGNTSVTRDQGLNPSGYPCSGTESHGLKSHVRHVCTCAVRARRKFTCLKHAHTKWLNKSNKTPKRRWCTVQHVNCNVVHK